MRPTFISLRLSSTPYRPSFWPGQLLPSYFSLGVSFCLFGIVPNQCRASYLPDGHHRTSAQSGRDRRGRVGSGRVGARGSRLPAPRRGSPGPQRRSLCPGEGTGAAAHSLFIAVYSDLTSRVCDLGSDLLLPSWMSIPHTPHTDPPFFPPSIFFFQFLLKFLYVKLLFCWSPLKA